MSTILAIGSVEDSSFFICSDGLVTSDDGAVVCEDMIKVRSADNFAVGVAASASLVNFVLDRFDEIRGECFGDSWKCDLKTVLYQMLSDEGYFLEEHDDGMPYLDGFELIAVYNGEAAKISGELSTVYPPREYLGWSFSAAGCGAAMAESAVFTLLSGGCRDANEISAHALRAASKMQFRCNEMKYFLEIETDGD